MQQKKQKLLELNEDGGKEEELLVVVWFLVSGFCAQPAAGDAVSPGILGPAGKAVHRNQKPETRP
eukprot:CAMPEP_0194759534 /NCGR_PEP_ID=MMETSP0323_2-20130528/12576_1 /TAXON_ID=2866 ORGANISM="Crypthecodinium cohnii, Strain Seligo" /NCGR_SAMPLE_ID=MMETSP0323_2 /ASSEMBLY_ACC=CAM_ASM_000346 /LENGTH=64 /DNA_ID=CAMNT_0039680319 /DNA_START=164 /DNA_END=354 /DNA_ORIENTATION=-